MAQHYSDPKRADDAHALPDVETFYVSRREMSERQDATGDDPPITGPGWYYWACFPGCLPDGDPVGPFETEAAALADAREGMDDGEDDA